MSSLLAGVSPSNIAKMKQFGPGDTPRSRSSHQGPSHCATDGSLVRLTDAGRSCRPTVAGVDRRQEPPFGHADQLAHRTGTDRRRWLMTNAAAVATDGE